MKFFISLGPNCEEASVNATRVTEKTVPATPIMAPDIVDSILRAESALLTRKKRPGPVCGKLIIPSMYTRLIAKMTDMKIIIIGINQKVAFSSFQKNSSLFII